MWVAISSEQVLQASMDGIACTLHIALYPPKHSSINPSKEGINATIA